MQRITTTQTGKIEKLQVKDLPVVTSGGKVASAHISTNVCSILKVYMYLTILVSLRTLHIGAIFIINL